MMVDLKVMAYFKISLSTRNWDRAFFIWRLLLGLMVGGLRKSMKVRENRRPGLCAVIFKKVG